MFTIAPEDVRFVGEGLSRCECVLATARGDLYTPDRRGGVAIVRADGRTEHLAGHGGPDGFLPNGIALLSDRSVLMADLAAGGVWKMAPDGAMTPLLLELDGTPLPPTNFVAVDAVGRIWVTFSTRLVPREQAMRQGHADGFIVLIDARGARIVADGIGYTNEALVDPSGRWLYVNETIARRTSRYPVRGDGSLGAPEVFAQYGAGTWPDGLAFDVDGGVWIVSVGSNRIIRTTADGRQHLVLEDADPVRLAECEAAFQEGRFRREHIDAGAERTLGNVSGIAFGGPDLRTIYLGSLFGTRIGTFRAPVAGVPPVHWDF